MHRSRTWLRLLSILACAALFAPGCKQNEGEVCQLEEECAEGLTCCGMPRACPGEPLPPRRGICMDVDTCPADAPLVCDAGVSDAGMDEDAGAGEDAGPADAGAGEDAGPPDAGPEDAGPPDAGPEDAGPPDAGPEDAGPDAGPDAS